MTKPTFSIKKDSYLNDDSLNVNYLHLKFNGSSINHVIMNTLRRILLDYIPCYAFDIDHIEINKNTSVFNNDYMRNRIENIPIHGLNYKFNIEDYEKLVKKEDIDDDFFSVYGKFINNNYTVKNITSDDLEFFQKSKKIKSVYKNPILIIKLKENEEIIFSAKAKLGLPSEHKKYSLVSQCVYEEINLNEYIFKIESANQLPIKDVLERGFEILKYKMNKIKDVLHEQKIDNKRSGKIILKNEDHTLGMILTRGLQDHDSISFAGYTIEHLLIHNITINYKKSNDRSFISILDEIIKNYNTLFDKMNSDIKKIL